MRNVPQLKLVREGQGWSQRDLAARSGVAPNTISQLERGERQAMPSTVRKLADALDVEPAMLLAESYLDMVIAKGAQGIWTLPQEAREAAKIERERRARVRATAKRQAERKYSGLEKGAAERYDTQRWVEEFVSGDSVPASDPFPEEEEHLASMRVSAEEHFLRTNVFRSLLSYPEDRAVARSRLASNDPKEMVEAAQLVLRRAKTIVEEYESYLEAFSRIPDGYYAYPARVSRIEMLHAALSERRVAGAEAVRELMDLHDECLDTLEDQIIEMRKEGDALEEFVRQAQR